MAKRSLQEVWQYTRQRLYRLTIGGYWAMGLPAETRHNLRWFWWDGLFAAAADNIVTTYLAVYILALGGTRGQIGLMSSLSSLSAALMLLPAALLVEQIGRRKEIALWVGGTGARLAILLLALIPLALDTPAVIWAAIVLVVVRDTTANFGYPAWASLTGDVIPAEGRGRYLGSRYTAMWIASMATTLLAGWTITRAEGASGYQWALLAAFALGVISMYCFAQLRDPQAGMLLVPGTAVLPRIPIQRVIPKMVNVITQGLKQHPAFAALLGTTALWNFALNVAGPFFSVYLVENLKATAAMVGATSVASSLAMLLCQRWWGDRVDRQGARRMQILAMLTIPILPILWLAAFAAWNILLVNLLGGALWAGYNLASFSLLLTIAPQQERARYSALHQIVVTASLAAGAAAGSVVVTEWGYPAIFIASAVGRFAAALLFIWLVKEVAGGAQAAA